MPQTELHRHLDVSVRLTTLLELAKKQGKTGSSTSLEEFGRKVYLRDPMRTLAEVLDTFTLFQKVLDKPETLERVAYEVVEDCYNEGTRRVELRFSPSFACETSGMPWEAALASFENGIARARKKFPDIEVGLICIASRDYGPEPVAETVDFFLKNRNRFVALDLAGNEAGFPCKLFEEAFRPAVKAGAPITVHAGEGAGPENIWAAIEYLGARRIGHGISCVQDPKLLQELQRRQICLEMCPTSNWITQAVKQIEEHPLPKVLRAGIPVCINTDDPGVFGVTLPHEKNLCRTRMGMSEAEIQMTDDHAFRFSFLNS
ncbi:adenosine deaminase [bacterium]|jgi:adenosine deaminase|nr:adenosine deaminase [bacterium]